MAKVWLNVLSKDNNRQQQPQQRLDAEPIIITSTTTTKAGSITKTFPQNYSKHVCCNSNFFNVHQQQRQHATTRAATKMHEQQCQRRLLLLSPQLTSAIGNDAPFYALHVTTTSASSSYSSSSSRGCVSNMNAAAAFAEAATLELTRKTQVNKLLQLDSRSFFYLALLVLVYCCVLMRASAAASHTAPFAENKTKMLAVSPASLRNTLPTPRSRSAIAPKTLLRLFKRNAANVPGHDNDDNDSSYHDDEFDEYDALINNKSAKGKYIGAPCNEMKCESTLLHVACDKETQSCGCERNYPVQLGLTKGCDKPKKLGEQCFYDATCQYSDENSLCVQVRHNALCQCASGFHSVSYTKPTRRIFCTQDLKELSSDLPTLLGVSTGIAVLAGLICMVLHLFSKTKYPRHRNFGDANLPPPIMYSSDTGIPLTVQSGRPSSRSSMRSSGSIGSYGNRRSSSGGLAGISSATAAGGGVDGGAIGTSGGSSKGILVSTSRTGSRRPSLASVHSTSSSVRSYSMMRFEKETQQKEIRQEMKLRLARLQHQQQLNQNKPQIIIGDTLIHHGSALSRITMPTPSPMTPNSMDELLPSVDEMQEYPPKPGFIAAVTLAVIKNVATATTTSTLPTLPPEISGGAAYIGPCSSSSTEAL